MSEINIYENSSVILSRKVPCKIVSWVSILIIMLVFIISFGTFYKFYKYETYTGFVKSDKLVLYVEKDKISNLKNEFILDNTIYNFKITSISEDYVINNNKNYYEVILEVNLDNKYIIDNNILNIKIKLEETTLMNEIFEFFKKGMI